MFTKNQHIARKAIIISVSFFLGIITTVIAAATYDASIQARSASMFAIIKSNASSMDPLDVGAYYTLIHLNIVSLVQVLNTLDASVTAEIIATSGTSDVSILNEITGEKNTNSNTQAPTPSIQNPAGSNPIPTSNNATVTGAVAPINTANNISFVTKDCIFSLKPYFNLGLKTTFYYGANNKLYEPTPNGQMTLPGDMNNQFNVTRAGSTDIEYGFQCQDGVLTVTDRNFSITTPLQGTLVTISTGSSNSNLPIVQNIDIICAGNGWPASVEVAVSGGDYDIFEVGKNGKLVGTLILSNQKAQLSSSTESIQIRPINSSEIISSVNISACHPNTYAARPEILTTEYNSATKILVVSTKNALSDDYIDIFDGSSEGALFWQKDKNGTYTANLSDPYYQGLRSYIETGKSHVGIYGSFEPNYWRNSVRYKTYPITIVGSSTNTPVLNIIRTNTSDGQNVEWTTSNTKSLSYSCIANGVIIKGDVELNRSKNFSSWINLHNAGWVAGKYTCIWKAVGTSTTIEKAEDFLIL